MCSINHVTIIIIFQFIIRILSLSTRSVILYIRVYKNHAKLGGGDRETAEHYITEQPYHIKILASTIIYITIIYKEGAEEDRTKYLFLKSMLV